VVPLSSTMYKPSRLFQQAFSKPVSPECAKVESPITAAICGLLGWPVAAGSLLSTASIPCAMVTEAPMSSRVSIAL